MSKKLILSSFVALALASPAMAEPANTSDTFPSDGYMQPDYTYLNAAVQSNLGVYEGNVTATAEYADVIYSVNPGWYLPAAGTEPAQCLANNYCSGATNLLYSETENQAINTCPIGYNSAEAGSDSIVDCYKECDIVENAVSMMEGGKDYYATGPDDCKIESCKPGYSIVGRGITGDHILSRVGGRAGTGTTPSDDTWSVDYGRENGMLVGDARCSVQTSMNTGQLLDDIKLTSGQSCYCNITEFKSSDGSFNNEVVSKWMFVGAAGANDMCAKECGSMCADVMSKMDGRTEYLRSALIKQISYVAERCDPNTITITWENADPADVSANNAGSVEYGGDIRTPVKATEVPGKTFRGWIFQKLSQ
ncbi:MAG: hypothetical protein R8M37_01145 [Alphaproteobacteria bacterium]|nr:hypothetical protein [Alphaproteobacteria bacterium]